MADIFTLDARRICEAVAPRQEAQILDNVWCGYCGETITIVRYSGRMEGSNLVLEGECERCSTKVARVIAND